MSASFSSLRSQVPRWLRGVFRLVSTAVLCLVVLHLMGKVRAPAKPQGMPEIAFQLVDGESLRLSELRGQRVLLNFWAEWCTPCRLEMPAIRRVAASYPDIVVIGVTADGSREQIRSAVQELEMTWPVSLPNPRANQIFQVSAYPTTILLDQSGQVVATHSGLLTDPQLHWLLW